MLTLACLIASILPSVPLFPNPPGIRIPETFLSLLLISETFNFSESILTKFTFRLFVIPPCVKASSNDLYASFNSTYLPIIAILTCFFVLSVILVIFFQGFKLFDFLDFILK